MISASLLFFGGFQHEASLHTGQGKPEPLSPPPEAGIDVVPGKQASQLSNGVSATTARPILVQKRLRDGPQCRHSYGGLLDVVDKNLTSSPSKIFFFYL